MEGLASLLVMKPLLIQDEAALPGIPFLVPHLPLLTHMVYIMLH